MKVIAGKQVYTTLEEILQPEHTALLLVDVQNDYFSPQGVLAQQRRDVSMCEAILPGLKRLLAQARERGVMTVHVQSTSLPQARSRSAPALYFWHVRYGAPPEVDRVVLGTWGHEIVKELAPRPGDTVIQKFRPSAFLGTGLHSLLRVNHIESIVVAGMATDGCVMATAMSGFYHDYYTVVVEDCVATVDGQRHAEALHLMSLQLDVVPLENVARIWSSSRGSEELTEKSDLLSGRGASGTGDQR